MECFICKREISDKEMKETKNVVAVNYGNKLVIVHIHHPGVKNLLTKCDKD